MLIFRAGIHKILVRIVNREEPDQKQSDMDLPCLSRLFDRQLSVRNFKIFTLPQTIPIYMLCLTVCKLNSSGRTAQMSRLLHSLLSDKY